MFDVLVVEQDSGIREVLVNVLTDAGYVVEAARDGLTALDRLRVRHPDIIVIDGVSGPELLAARRMDPSLGAIPAVVASLPYDEVDSMAVYLKKPFTMDDLLAALARCEERALAAARRGPHCVDRASRPERGEAPASSVPRQSGD